MVAFRFMVHADGWRRLCLDLRLDPEVLLRQLPGYDTLEEIQTIAGDVAFNADEALAYAKERFRSKTDGHRLETAEDVARAMRKSLQEQVDTWN